MNEKTTSLTICRGSYFLFSGGLKLKRSLGCCARFGFRHFRLRGLKDNFMLTEQQVIKRLCALSTKVGEDIFCNQKAHDCFCGENNTSEVFTGGFQFEEEVIAFIEEAVRDKMDKQFYLEDY